MNVNTLVQHYMEWADRYFRDAQGKPTSRVAVVRTVLEVLVEHCGHLDADSFRPNDLRALRDKWIERGLARTTVNNYTAVVRSVWKWGAGREMVAPETVAALSYVEDIPKGRGLAVEPEPVEPVPDEYIEAVLPHLPDEARALVDLQLLTGARPGELLSLRAEDVDRSGDVWVAQLRYHKKAYAGRTRRLYFGPKAQTILRPYLLSPRPFRRYSDVAAYRRAVARACRRAGVEPWSPNQLRHTAATRIRKEWGLEAAQIILGHAKADVTQVYAERDEEKALAVAAHAG